MPIEDNGNAAFVRFPRAGGVLLWALLLIPAIVEIAGVRSAHLLSQDIWTPLGLHRLWRYSILFAAASLPVAVVFRRYYFAAVIAAIVIGSAAAVGPLAAGSVLVFVFSATVIGRLIFGTELEARLAFMAGLSVWIVSMTVLARLPIHYPGVYWIALALPLLAGYSVSRRLAMEWLQLLRPRPISVPGTLALLLLSFIMIAHWLIVLKPEAGTDALATHLAIPMHMAQAHMFDFDFRRFIWALMPLGTDLCYTVLYIIGSEYAARLLNFALLTCVATLLFQEARRFASNAAALFITALFVSTPLVQLVTGSLFVENFVAAMCLAGVAALWRYRETRDTRYFLLTAVLLGTALSLKLAAFAVVLLAIPFLARAMPKPRLAISAALGFAAIASIPYANACLRSNNPIFPYANSTFHSPYVGADLVDVRFHPALSWSTPARLTFFTHDYFEGQNGTFGFQYLLLLPLTLAYVIAARSFVGRSAAIIGIGGAIVIAITQPNARYFYPVLPFLSLGAVAAISWVLSMDKRIFTACLIAGAAAAVANIYFLPASNYHHRDFYTSPLLKASGRREYREMAAPVRDVIEYLNRTAPGEPVFYADNSQIAGLLAPVYRNSWHDYAFMKQVEACATPAELYRLVAGLGIKQIVIDHYTTERLAPLAALIATCTEPEYKVWNYSALRLRDDCESRLGGKHE